MFQIERPSGLMWFNFQQRQKKMVSKPHIGKKASWSYLKWFKLSYIIIIYLYASDTVSENSNHLYNSSVTDGHCSHSLQVCGKKLKKKKSLKSGPVWRFQRSTFDEMQQDFCWSCGWGLEWLCEKDLWRFMLSGTYALMIWHHGPQCYQSQGSNLQHMFSLAVLTRALCGIS